MKVVISFPKEIQIHEEVISGRDISIEGTSSKCMVDRIRVSNVSDVEVSSKEIHPRCDPKRLIPEVNGNKAWQNHRKDEPQNWVVPLRTNCHEIVSNISFIDLTYVGMLSLNLPQSHSCQLDSIPLDILDVLTKNNFQCKRRKTLGLCSMGHELCR